VPLEYIDALHQWRVLFPSAPPTLHVLTNNEDCTAEALLQRPLLVKLRGSSGPLRPAPMPSRPGASYEPHTLGPAGERVLDLATDTGHLVVTGYSGRDHDIFPALLGRLERSRFDWSAHLLPVGVVQALAAVDSGQPRVEHATSVLRGVVQSEHLPRWPTQRCHADDFFDRLVWWSKRHRLVASIAFASILIDAGDKRAGVALMRRAASLAKHRNWARIVE
jgi:hypothetical protein